MSAWNRELDEGHDGSFFGHVYPGIYCMIFAVIFWMTSSDHRRFNETMGRFLIGMSSFSIVLETVCAHLAGVEFFWFKLTHLCCYFGYFVAGVNLTLLADRLPEKMGRIFTAIAFLLEGGILMMLSSHWFHVMEEQIEYVLGVQGLMMCALVLAHTMDEKREDLWRVLVIWCAFWKALTFVFDAFVVYTGTYGVDGKEYQTHHLYPSMAILAVIAEILTTLLMIDSKGSTKKMPEESLKPFLED